MTVKLLTEHHLEVLSLVKGCTGSSESTLVKTPHCCKSHVVAQITVVEVCLSYSFIKSSSIEIRHHTKGYFLAIIFMFPIIFVVSIYVRLSNY